MQANLREAMTGSSVAQVARGAGVPHRDVRDALHSGEADMWVVAKLEAYLDTTLWPERQHADEATVHATAAKTQQDRSVDS